MKTTLHHYYLHTDKADECKAYKQLREQLAVTHAGKFFNVLADTKHVDSRKTGAEEVDLETNFLFENQWNETTESGNRRLFDWYEAIYPNNKVKHGHWLEITPEMTAIREQTLTCGYCGKFVKSVEPHLWHCEKCLGSEYLKEKDLGLLRLLPVACKNHKVSLAMTDDERAEIMPRWKEAQGLGNVSREAAKLSKHRQKIAALIPAAEKKSDELLRAAKVETKALTWLMDHDLQLIDNCIFYTHTWRFGFGWRTPLTDEEKSKLLDVISEFPFDYDIK
jgi:hypothetical protein